MSSTETHIKNYNLLFLEKNLVDILLQEKVNCLAFHVGLLTKRENVL